MSNPTEITARMVETITPPEQGQVFIRDSLLPGFSLRVTANGVKAFVVEGKVNGKSRRITLGKCTALTLKDARKLARQNLGDFAKGHDPVAARRAEQAKTITLGEVFAAYLDSHDLKPVTIDDYHKAMAAFSDWRNRPVVQITRNMVERRHAELGERSKARANNAMRVLRALLNFAAGKYEDENGQPIITHNPVTRLSATKSWYRIERRRTLIKAHQLPSWFDAVMQLESERATGKATVVRDYLLFLLFTGLRRQEAARLRWTDLDFNGRTFIITDTKNREAHELPLSDFLLDLVTRRKADAGSSPYVFPGAGGTGHIVEPRRWMKLVTEASGVEFTLHDLRRSFITIAESLDIPAYALKRLLNHKNGADVTGGYIVIDTERLRQPMQKITDFILKSAGVKATAQVVALRERAK